MEDDLNNLTPANDLTPAEKSQPNNFAPSRSNGGNDPLPKPAAPVEETVQPVATEEIASSPSAPRNDEVAVPTQNSFIKNLLQKAGEKIQFNKRRKLEKIMEFVRQKGSVNNADVEKLLHVSDSTASRYLNQLIKQNKLKRSGSPEKPKYEK